MGLGDSPAGKDGRLSPEPVLGDSDSCHLRTPIILTQADTLPRPATFPNAGIKQLNPNLPNAGIKQLNPNLPNAEIKQPNPNLPNAETCAVASTTSWDRHRDDQRPRNGSRFSPIPQQVTGRWLLRSLVPASNMRSRQENISPHCGGRLFQGPSLQGDLAPRRGQQAGGTHGGPLDRRSPRTKTGST